MQTINIVEKKKKQKTCECMTTERKFTSGFSAALCVRRKKKKKRNMSCGKCHENLSKKYTEKYSA